LIKSNYTTEKFDVARTKELAAAIADPANMICFVTSQSFEAESFPLKEKWYNIPFSKEKLSKELLDKLKKPVVADNGMKLDLPTPNTFLPKNFDVIKANSEFSKIPVLMFSDKNTLWPGTDIWLKKDDKFDTPKATILCKIYTRDLHFGETPNARVFAIMWKECLESMMCELNY